MPKEGRSDFRKLHRPIRVSVSWCKIPIALIAANFLFDISVTFVLFQNVVNAWMVNTLSEILGSLDKSILVELVSKHWSAFGIV